MRPGFVFWRGMKVMAAAGIPGLMSNYGRMDVTFSHGRGAWLWDTEGRPYLDALSGIAVNHVKDWDPSFHSYSRTVELGPLVGEDEIIADTVRNRLGIDAKPSDVYRGSDERLDLVFDKDKRTVHVDTTTGRVVDEGQKPRFVLRAANWLHLNRGKKAWTYIADAYAGGLLFLAMSGMFMIPGRKGLVGRGAVLVAVGIAIPVVYLQLAGSAIR